MQRAHPAALQAIAAGLPGQLGVAGGVHPFGDHLAASSVQDVHRARQGVARRRVRQGAMQQAFVQLDRVRLQQPHARQAKFGSAKVVQRQLEAKAPVAVHAALQAQQIDFSVFDNFQRQL